MKNIISEVINKYINNIINESKDLLTERVSSIVYHWCSPQTAVKILNTNRFSLMSNLFKNAESNIIGTSHNRMWYMSLTRNGKIGQGGYSDKDHPWVRFTLDGDKLNSNFHSKAIDYWGKSMGKNARYDSHYYNVNGYVKKPGTETESEDRLFSRKPFIEDALSYVKAIDIYLDITKYDGTRDSFIQSSTVECIYYLFLKYNKSLNCKVYTSVQDFNNHKNPINYDTFSNWFNNKKETRDLNFYDISKESKNNLPADFLSSIVYVVNFLDGNLNDCLRTLKEYGLNKYAKQVANYIQNNRSWDYNFYFGDKSSYDFNSIQRNILGHFNCIELANSAQSLNREDLAKAYSILSDFCKRYKLKTKYDIVRYFAKVLGKRENDFAPNNKLFNITCTRLQNTKLYLCIEPSKTKYKDIFGTYTLRNLYDDLINYVDNHKSKNDKKFQRYLNHLFFKSNGPTIQDVIKIYDNLKSLGNERLDLDYKPELITKSITFWELNYCITHPDYEYGTSIETTDGDYIKVIKKEDYKKLKELINNYE